MANRPSPFSGSALLASVQAQQPFGDAVAQGHTMAADPGGMSGATRRWTCATCGRAVLQRGSGRPYGSALTESCRTTR